MITLFACPKPFTGHFDVIQRNSIKSWLHLKPKPEILLLGNDEGVAEVCKELGLIHIPEIEKNEYGTPLVSSVFSIGQERASYPTVCYINSDIILMCDFIRAAETVTEKMTKFLFLGQRWDLDVRGMLDFDTVAWEGHIKSLLKQDGVLHAQTGIDFFAFPKGMYTNIPPFAIGRLAWDNWLVWRARKDGIPVIDVTKAVKIVHQNHDYSSSAINKLTIREIKPGNYRKSSDKKIVIFDGNVVELGPEAQRNYALVRPEQNLNIWAATWVIDPRGVLKRRRFSLAFPFIWYQIKGVLPIYWPAFGRFVRWMLMVRKTLLRRW
jgi:hypothetical protein